ncbi:MAG: hypothetical protein WBQ23_12160 [Bacteroidota bacterium]
MARGLGCNIARSPRRVFDFQREEGALERAAPVAYVSSIPIALDFDLDFDVDFDFDFALDFD